MKNMFKNAGKMVLFTCLSLMLLTACGQKSYMFVEYGESKCCVYRTEYDTKGTSC